MYLPEVASDGCMWGRTLARGEWFGVLAKVAASGQWQALYDVLSLVSAGDGPGADTKTALLCDVDSSGRKIAEIAAQNGHWVTAWLLVNKCGAGDGGSDATPALIAALERGTCLASELQKAAALKVKVESNAAAIKAVANPGCRVIHVDDDLPAEESGDDSHSNLNDYPDADWNRHHPEVNISYSMPFNEFLRQFEANSTTLPSWDSLEAANSTILHDPVPGNPVQEANVQQSALPPPNRVRRSSRRTQHTFRTDEVD